MVHSHHNPGLASEKMNRCTFNPSGLSTHKASSLGLLFRDVNMNTNHSPFLQEASGLVEVRFALLQDEKEFAGKRRGARAGRKECQAGVAGWLTLGTAINEWLLKHLKETMTLCLALKTSEEIRCLFW